MLLETYKQRGDNSSTFCVWRRLTLVCMKINEKTRINGGKTVLVPYQKFHVPKYHEWMKSEELQLLTASEPLTLEQEYEMQQSWRVDENKCTFIVLDADLYSKEDTDEIDSMIGDVNLFFNDPESPNTAEIEIMIAEPWARGKGCGKEALNSMIRFGIQTLGVQTFSAKVGVTNGASLGMFHRIGFKEISRSEVFKEITMELPVTEELMNTLISENPSYKIEDYIS